MSQQYCPTHNDLLEEFDLSKEYFGDVQFQGFTVSFCPVIDCDHYVTDPGELYERSYARRFQEPVPPLLVHTVVSLQILKRKLLRRFISA